MFGLAIDLSFHKSHKWLCDLTYHLYEQILEELNPVIVGNQSDYDKA